MPIRSSACAPSRSAAPASRPSPGSPAEAARSASSTSCSASGSDPVSAPERKAPMKPRKPSTHLHKRTGAQARNTNTFKHGFYGALLTVDEHAGLAGNISLDDEQKLLRSRARRLAARIKLSGSL